MFSYLISLEAVIHACFRPIFIVVLALLHSRRVPAADTTQCATFVADACDIIAFCGQVAL